MTKNPIMIENFFNQKKLYIQNGFACGDWNDLGRGIIQLRPFNVSTNGQIDLTTVKYIEVERNLSQYLLQKNDVIFNNTNSEELVGKTALWSQTQKAVLSNHMTIVRVLDEKELSPQFLSFYLLKKWMDGYFHQVCQRHVNQASVSIERLKTTPFPEFGIVEQRRIAHILSTVQTAIEQQERLIALTRELKSALMHRLFTEGLRGEPQKQTEMGLIPESWTYTTLGDLASKPDGLIQTGPFGSQLHKDEYTTEGIPVVNPTNLLGNRINPENISRISCETAKPLKRHILKKGDILFGRRGEIGRHGLVTEKEDGWFCGTGSFMVRVRKPIIDNRFLNLYFSTSTIVNWLNSNAAGAIMPNLSTAVLKRMPVFYPSIEEQKEIADCLEMLEKKLQLITEKKNLLEELFRTLLHQLMTGQIRVNEIEIEEFL